MGMTIREVAEKTGTSKSTAMRAAKRLGLLSSTNKTGSRGAVELDEQQASMLAHELTTRRPDARPSQQPNHARNDSVSDSVTASHEPIHDEYEAEDLNAGYIARIRTLTAENKRLMERIKELTADVERLKAEETALQKRYDERGDKIEALLEKIEAKQGQLETERELNSMHQQENASLKFQMEMMKRAPLIDRIFRYRRLPAPEENGTRNDA